MSKIICLLLSFGLFLPSALQAQMTDDTAETDEDTPVSFTITNNDNVLLPQENSVDLNTSLPGRQTTATTTEGNYAVDNSGLVTFTPALNFFGVADHSYSMRYGLLGMQTGTADITVTINPLNDPPVANADDATTAEDTPVSFDILDNDTDVDDTIDPLSVITSNATGGTFTVNNTGEVTFTPAPGFNGSATATYTVRDAAGATSNSSAITVTVDPVNDPPIAISDAAFTTEGSPVIIAVLENDSDPDGSLVASSVSIGAASGGTFVANTSGEVTFTPVPGFNGSATATYTVTDNGGLVSNAATITVSIDAVNDPPVATNDQATMNEDETPVVISILSNDLDPDSQIDATSVLLSGITNGNFTVNGAGVVTYAPPANFNGTATARYTVSDEGGLKSNEATITVTVNPVNDPPLATNDNVVTDEGVVVTFNVIANDTDPDGSINGSTVNLTNAAGGTFTASSGEVTFTPTPGFNGTATANYTVKDNAGLTSNTATISVTVNAVNDPPVALPDAATMNEDASAISINVISNDSDPDGSVNPASITLNSQTNGTFSATAAGTVTYQPPPNFYGTATARYTVKDNEGLSSGETTITVTVSPVNDTPSFTPIQHQRVLENSAVKSITITGISAGPSENEALTLTASSSNPALVPHPVIVYNGSATNATLTFKPQPGQFGTVSITVELTDTGQGGSNKFTNTFQIEVVEVRFTSVPVTVAIPAVMYEYIVTVSDVTETLAISAVQKPAWLTLTSTGKNSARISGTPPSNASISNPVTLQLKDGTVVLDQQQYTLLVNRIPSAGPFALQTPEDTALPFAPGNFEGAYTDPDGQPLSAVRFSALPRHGMLVLNNSALTTEDKIAVSSIPSVSYVPAGNYHGPDTVGWKANDGYSYSQNEASISFVVSPVNDPPEFNFVDTTPLLYELGSEIPVKLAPASTVTDVDDNQITGAEIGIRFLSYQPEKEFLIFNDTLEIQGVFNEAAGILVLSGVSSVQNYQAAIRSIKFNYVNLEEVQTGTSEVYVSLTDGENTGEPKSRSIELIYTFRDLFIPTAFTPNDDDAVNATWVIRSPNTPDGSVPYDHARIRVFNKHGAMVFESTGFEDPWDGTYNGVLLPPDTYYYTIDLNYNRVKYRGVVTLLR